MAVTNKIVKSTLNLIIASAKEQSNPGSFKETFSTLQISNDLPQLDFGNVDLGDLLFVPNTNSIVEQVIVSDETMKDPMPAGASSTEREPDVSREVACPTDVAGDLSFANCEISSISELKIRMFKNKTAPRVTKLNWKELYQSGDVCFDGDCVKPQQEYFELLTNNKKLREQAISMVQVLRW